MSDITLEVGTQILFNESGTYAPTVPLSDIELATPTDVAFDITGVVTTAAEQSAKADLLANRALAYSVIAAIEIQATPTTGATIDFYWAPSPITTAGTGNTGYTTGVSGAYTGTPADLAEALAQLTFIGALVCTADIAIQVAVINPRFLPGERFGNLVMVNNSGATLHTDAIESAVSFIPIIGDVE